MSDRHEPPDPGPPDGAPGPDLRRADEIFDRALDLTGRAREVFVHDECAGDAALADVVWRLLRACEEPDAARALHTGGAHAGAFAAELEGTGTAQPRGSKP